LRFSIITVNRNNAFGLKKTIESVLCQNCTDFEFIIIDGASTDTSLDIINSYSDNISKWISEPDTGVYNAMNKGIMLSKGDYLIFMNSGDCFYNSNVLQMVSLEIKSEDIILGWRKTDKGKIERFNVNISALSLLEGGVFHQSSFIKRELALKYPYNETKKVVSDWQFFFRTLILDNCEYKIIQKPLCLFDTNGISCTNTPLAYKEKGELLKEMLPERIFHDYMRFFRINSPIINLIPEIYKYRNYHMFVYKIDYILVYIHRLFVMFFKN
jgi:glycosyltransferase involved in cell wall biosynthesis